MNDEKERFFTVVDSGGKKQIYEILFTFQRENNDYIVFTDNNTLNDGSTVTYAATYKKNGDNLVLSDIKSDKEWNIIEGIISQLEDKMNEE